MKYAIYDKAAYGYLTDMDFTTDIPNTELGLSCKYNERITEAKLLNMKKTAIDAVTIIEGYKFVEKGRFVIHSFDDTLNDQYIISEAGNPAKVVDNITVDLDGTINVKYGTMMSHWSTMLLENAVNRMFVLQNAASDIYTSWSATFDIYKVITIIDEKEHTHYQFIKVTDEGLDFAKDEEESSLSKHITSNWKYLYEESYKDRVTLNKRIDELEKANYELGERVAERGAVANRLLDENNSLKNKVESIKKEARNWKSLYENADSDREELKNVIDIIHTDLVSTTACNDLKDTLKAIYHNSGLDHISMENFLTAKDEICSIINHVITIMESREFNQNVAFSSAEEVNRAKKFANDIIDICEATTDPFELTLVRYRNERLDMDKEIKELRTIRDSLAEVIYAIRNAICKERHDAFDCIIYRMKYDPDFNSNPFMAGARENIKDICTAEKKNIANHDLKNSEIARLTDERDKALEQKNKYKRMLNSEYGMTIPSRCCGKQLMADILSGKKIPVNKQKYDDLMECINEISLTYEMMKFNPFSMNRPSWLSGIINRINNLTK